MTRTVDGVRIDREWFVSVCESMVESEQEKD